MTHNLDISMYSFKDLLGLFDLSDKFGLEDMKRAKHKVLKTHPDKSGLSSDYFLFYKKAYDIIYHFFEENVKQNARVENREYTALNESNQMKQQINKKQSSMTVEQFNDKFNNLFEKNMIYKKINERNAWFSQEDSLYDKDQMQGNMSVALDNMRSNSQTLIRRNEIQTLGQGGTSLYEDDDEYNERYMQSDPFSKLKYDDLRKVHKDETIFSVKESDIDHVKQYATHDQLKFARSQQNLTPLEKEKAQKCLHEQYENNRNDIRMKYHKSSIAAMKNEENSKKVLSSFLMLEN